MTQRGGNKRRTAAQLNAMVEAARVLAAAGWSYVGMAEAFCSDVLTLRRHVPDAPQGKIIVRDEAAELEMESLFRMGNTLQSIGDRFGVSRERVRQILKRRGVRRQEGGQHVQGQFRRAGLSADRRKRKDERAIKFYGCDYATALDLNGQRLLSDNHSPAHRYIEQKRNAGARNIEWKLTFREWTQIWRDSGRYEERGRGKGSYCLARKADAGAYEIGNVYIATNEQNISESYETTPTEQRQKVNTKLRLARERRERALQLHLAGLKNAEIAAHMGVAATYVSNLLVYARREAKSHLSENSKATA
jgi:hypothetical protein